VQEDSQREIAIFEPLYRYTDDKPVIFYDSADITINWKAFFMYFGLVFFIGLSAYFLKRAFKKKDLLIWFPIFIYMPLFLYFMHGSLVIRYLAPLLVFLILLGSIGLRSIKNRLLVYAVITFCVLQFISASIYTYSKRKIPPGVKEAYLYLKNNTLPNARVLNARNPLALHAQRPIIWLGVPSLHEIGFFFWQADREEMQDIFDRYDIHYILVEKDQIYDDQNIRHTGGYPKSFVEKLPDVGIFTEIFDNQDAVLWRIERRTRP
jgi:hypothetical protein